jgi:hypothetical protein
MATSKVRRVGGLLTPMSGVLELQAHAPFPPRRAPRPAPPLPSPRARVFVILHLRVVEHCGDQQDWHRRPSQRDSYTWYGSTMKSLRRTGRSHEAAGLLQIVDVALEKLLVGEHRKAGGADLAVALGIALGDVGRNEVFAQHALARAGFLTFGNHRGVAGSDLGAQRAFEIARQHAALGVEAHRFERRCSSAPQQSPAA